MTFLIFIATIIIVRAWLGFTRKLFIKRINFINTSPTIAGLKFHHYIYGIVLMIIGWTICSHSLIGFIGLGLFIDEFPLIIKYGNDFHWKEYWSEYSIIWLIISTLSIGFILIIF